MDFGLIIFIATAVIFAAIGIWYTKGKKFSAEDFLNARSSLKVGAATATIFASGMGAWVLFGPAETSITAGLLALVGYALASALSLWIFAWLGVRMRKLMPEGHTLTEYVLHRFGKMMYVLVLLITLFYMALAITAELTGIALAGKMVYGIPALATTAVVGLGTLAYTAIGGFKASVFTDRVQTWVILPLLALVVLGSVLAVGGFGVLRKVDTALFSYSWPGLEYGIVLIIAIVGAELFNQGWWQRVYAGKSQKVMQKSFIIAGWIIIPIILIAGLFGFFALTSNVADEPSVAMFTFLMQITPTWVLTIAMVLAIALIMSSMDTLLNGMVSVFTIDVKRLKPKMSSKKLLLTAKLITVVLAVAAVLVATEGYSVLYLFLVADLVCVGAVWPVFYGMFQAKLSGKTAFWLSLLGVLIGASLFPKPDFSGSFIPGLPSSLLWSFVLAFAVPFALSFLFKAKKGYDFAQLKKVTSIR